MRVSRRLPPLSLLLALFLGLLLAGCSNAPTRPQGAALKGVDDAKPYLSQLIRHEMAKNSITGLSIALVDDQRVVWAEGFGYADKEQAQAASAETIYRVGSISKLLTATAAMQLVEQKKLDLDLPLQKYLPDFSVQSRFQNTAPITVRNLLTHHSGLPRDLSKGMFSARPVSATQFVEQVKHSDVDYPPNLVFSYSNLGFTLLGYTIQNISGVPFKDYMQHSVLEPLGMRTATFEAGPTSSSLMSKAYRRGKPADEWPLRDVPAVGLNASVLDLGRFLSMVFASGKVGEQQVLKPQSVAQMLSAQNVDVPLDLNFRSGLGWMLSTLGASTIENAGPVAHHAGSTLFFRSEIYALPEHKLGVVVLANSSSAGQVVDRLATQALAIALQAKTGITQPARQKVLPANPTGSVEQLRPFVGDYATIAGHVRLRLDHDKLKADALGQAFDLVPRSDGLLGIEYSLLGLLPVDLRSLGDIGFTRRSVSNREVLIAVMGQQEMLIGERIQPPTHVTRWLQRLGSYEVVQTDEDRTVVDRMALIEDHGFLLVDLAINGRVSAATRVPLQPVSDTEATLLGQLANGGDTLRCQGDAQTEQCSFAGYTLRKLTH